jgi:adenylosuccinate lyase
MEQLNAIGPLDGRYKDKLSLLEHFFSERALIKYRVFIETKYFLFLSKLLPEIGELKHWQWAFVDQIDLQMEDVDYQHVKEIERTINHDVKAVEYYVKERLEKLELGQHKEWIHFGLTSNDVNSAAYALILQKYLKTVLVPQINEVRSILASFGDQWEFIPILQSINKIVHRTKFGGATGGLNAHYTAYPNINWRKEMDSFIGTLGLEREQVTTQIDHYDTYAEIFHATMRLNTVLYDLCRDVWLYISMDYFKLQIVEGEVGSSTMPHKVNPIDFENAKGNFLISNGMLGTLANELPVSLLQRDLKDSTMLRSLGPAFGHGYLAMLSLCKGLKKLSVNEPQIVKDLDDNWVIIGEAIQTILRKYRVPNAYELLKEFTRTHSKPGKQEFQDFIDGLDIPDTVKDELRDITPRSFALAGVRL